MAVELKTELRVQPQLVMTPMLQQAIKLLQLSRLELVETVRQEMEENPLLEDGDPQLAAGDETQELREIYRHLSREADPSFYRGMREEREEGPGVENLSRRETLHDHLRWQLGLTSLDRKEKEIGEHIIGNIDESGYLRTSLEEIAERTGSPVEKVEEVLYKIQQFDPPGVGARDLKECLVIQARMLGLEGSLVERIIKEHLNALEQVDLKKLAGELGVELQEVEEAVRVIKGMDPKPGRNYGLMDPIYVVPDVYVYKLGDEYVVVLNDDGLPKLRISSFYQDLLEKEDLDPEVRSYIQEKMRSALWLIKSIYHRQQTLYRVAKTIVEIQRDFLDRGIEYLKPMTLRDVAERLDIHESTVSRATANKYIHTPQGIYELKFFFNTGVGSAGEEVSSEVVKEMIRKIIAEEDPANPLSDSEIVEILKSRNIDIARRTVAKYRMMKGIPPSNKRRRIFAHEDNGVLEEG